MADGAPSSSTAAAGSGAGDAPTSSATAGGLSAEVKERKYNEVLKASQNFFKKYEVDAVGKMATLNSLLKMTFPSFWFVGFYTLKEDGETLQIGAYQGDLLACGVILSGKGVCGTAAATRETQIVPDVSKIENYIACDDDTKSEIVVPCFTTSASGERTLFGVLDIDSDQVNTFDEVDRARLEQLCRVTFEGASE